MKEEEVKRLLNMNEVLNVVEQVFKEKALGKVQMPPKMYVDLLHDEQFEYRPTVIKRAFD